MVCVWVVPKLHAVMEVVESSFVIGSLSGAGIGGVSAALNDRGRSLMNICGLISSVIATAIRVSPWEQQ